MAAKAFTSPVAMPPNTSLAALITQSGSAQSTPAEPADTRRSPLSMRRHHSSVCPRWLITKRTVPVMFASPRS